MKESILDVLMFLFENYMDDEHLGEHDQETLRVELQEAGFPHREINKAFDWLQGLAGDNKNFADGADGQSSIRVYSSEESAKLGMECRGFLLFLEQSGALDPIHRELIIDRAMELDHDEISLEQLKWVILMVLYNQPDQESTFVWMENLVYDDLAENLH